MTSRTRRRWRAAAASKQVFHHDHNTATLGAPASVLRSAVGCTSTRAFERQLAAAETEGWLERSPEVCIDLDRLDARMRSDEELSAKAHRGAQADIDHLATHHITFVRHPHDWVPVDANGDTVVLAQLAPLLDVTSQGTAHWRLARIRRLLTAQHPPSAPTPSPTTPPPTAPPLDNATPGVEQPSDLGRLIGLLETETDCDTRRHLAHALANLTTVATNSRPDVANDSRPLVVRDTSARVRSESVPEQELHVPVPNTREPARRETAVRDAKPRDARGLAPSTQWDSTAEVEPLIAPLEQRCGAIGPKARRALMQWDPEQVRHAIEVLIGWVDAGMELRNPSGYLIAAATHGYCALFPLTGPPTSNDHTQRWAERAATVTAQVCVDLIANEHCPTPGRPYDKAQHLVALAAAATTNPDIVNHYRPDHPDAPTPDELAHYLEAAA